MNWSERHLNWAFFFLSILTYPLAILLVSILDPLFDYVNVYLAVGLIASVCLAWILWWGKWVLIHNNRSQWFLILLFVISVGQVLQLLDLFKGMLVFTMQLCWLFFLFLKSKNIEEPKEDLKSLTPSKTDGEQQITQLR